MLALLEDTEDNIIRYWIDLPLDVSGWNFVIFETENQGPPHPNVEILGAFPKRYPSYERSEISNVCTTAGLLRAHIWSPVWSVHSLVSIGLGLGPVRGKKK